MTENKHPRLFDGDTFTHKGYSFRVTFRDDQDADPPWENEDGHGPVSDWTRRDKSPGERVLCADQRSRRYYDIAEAIKIAKRDGWGCSHSKIEDGKFISGHKTKGELAACAVEQDYEHLRKWCNNDWCYVGVIVTLLDDDDNPTDETESLWGIESDSTDYLTSTAYDLADEILSRIEVENPDVQPSEN